MNEDEQRDSRSESDDEGWVKYYVATQGRPPRPLLVRGVATLGRAGDALELGFGAGNEVRYLLDRGFRVTAVDADAGAVTSLGRIPDPNVRIVHAAFADFAFGIDAYDLVSAQYALPFNPPGSFDSMFAKLLRSIRQGGLFVGNLWGERDQWNTPDSRGTFHRREEATMLFDGFELDVFEEYEEEVELACDGTKHGHWYEIIARCPA